MIVGSPGGVGWGSAGWRVGWVQGLDLVAFGPFKRWYHKQQIGYKLTKHYLFTPRGSRYALCSPRFQRALDLTG
eukprot:COSAG01_NODE_68758_length_263_cov_0.634146_1_plen_73_part_01